jgi:antibiotic biosynthesis monooxygenase (ABM) superfamily enzyme
MEKAGTDPEYVLGWQCAYLHNPKREEQRLTDAYNAGYEDGGTQKMNGYTAWIK